VNLDPGSVTVVVAEFSGGGGSDAVLDIYVMIDTDHAKFVPGHLPSGFRPAAPVDVIAWKNVTVLMGTTQEFTANIGKARGSDAGSTTVQCLVTGSYAGADYNQTREAVIVWP